LDKQKNEAPRMPEIKKHASRISQSHIREVLNRAWDPIGGCPEDEYDGYIGKIAALLRDNASDDELLAYLEWAEVEHMGLGPPSHFDQAAA
jgi:hypothetical protein